MEEERIRSAFIPDNFQTGINVMGKSYTIISLIEGGALLLLFGGGTFIILRNFNVAIETVIGVSLAVGAPLGALGVMGINNEPLHTFFLNVIKYFKNRRIAKYNPRIKTEAKPVGADGDTTLQADMLPRDKVIKYYEQFKSKMDERSRNKMLESEEQQNNQEQQYYFEDDIGIIDMPGELMSNTNKKQKKQKKGGKADEEREDKNK